MARAVRAVGGLLSVLAALVLLVDILPRTAGVGWEDTADRIEILSPFRLTELIALWAAGLWAHTYVLQRGLPGLSRRRAVALNLGGSSVSNVLPFGGAAGIGLNYAMLKSWGYTRPQITAYTTVTNLVVTVVKALLAIAGVIALLRMPAVPIHFSNAGILLSVGTAVVLLVVLGLGYLGLRQRFGASLHAQVAETVRHVRGGSALLLRRGWRGFTLGGLGYPALQIALLFACLSSVYCDVSFAVVLAAFSVERLVTLLPLTPGGVGVAETAATGVLIAFGADPPTAAAGVVLYRVFSYLIEIPLGAVIAGAWFAQSRDRAVAE